MKAKTGLRLTISDLRSKTMTIRSEIDKLMGGNAPALTRIIVINIVVFLLANLYINISPAGEWLDYV